MRSCGMDSAELDFSWAEMGWSRLSSAGKDLPGLRWDARVWLGREWDRLDLVPLGAVHLVWPRLGLDGLRLAELGSTRLGSLRFAKFG